MDGTDLAQILQTLNKDHAKQFTSSSFIARHSVPFADPQKAELLNLEDDTTSVPSAVFKDAEPGSIESLFGKPFAYDFNDNGCPADQDVLARDLQDPVLDTDGCTVLSGTLTDPYTGQTVAYEKGSDEIVIDYVVPLEYAHLSGIQTRDIAASLANDPLNLVVTTADAVAQKRPESGMEPAWGWADRHAERGQYEDPKPEQVPGWMPADQSFHDAYRMRFALVSAKYAIGNGASDGSQLEQLKKITTEVDPDSGDFEALPASRTTALVTAASETGSEPSAPASSAEPSTEQAEQDQDDSGEQDQDDSGMQWLWALLGLAAVAALLFVGIRLSRRDRNDPATDDPAGGSERPTDSPSGSRGPQEAPDSPEGR
ncbi:hypothetical protein ACHMXD_02795 [Micrococcus luteus]